MGEIVLLGIRGSIPQSWGSLCCEFLMLIIALQPQYNAVGEIAPAKQHKTNKSPLH